MPQLLIGTVSEECINCGALSFLEEHVRTKHSYCQNGKVEDASVNYPEALKNFCSAVILMLYEHFWRSTRVREQRGHTPSIP